METLKNFLAGLLIVSLAFIIIFLGFLLWPFMLGIGSLILFLAIIAITIILVFYVTVLIGYVVRKGFHRKG